LDSGGRKEEICSGNTSYYSVQKLLCAHLLPKNVKIRIYDNTVTPSVLYGPCVGGMHNEGVGEQGVEGNIWTEEE
jgi:hypothetical protein